MNEKRNRGDDFESRLLNQLKGVVAERDIEARGLEAEDTPVAASVWRRRGPRLAFGGGLALAAVATALAINAGSDNSSKAFAVEPQDGGGVTIKVYGAEDAAGLEAALAEAGIRSQITWLPAGMECREPHYTQSEAPTALGGKIGGMSMAGPGAPLTIGVMTVEQYRALADRYRQGEISAKEFSDSTGNITLDPSQFSPDQTVVLSGAPGPSASLDAVIHGATEPLEIDPEGGYEAHFGVAKGAVEPCEAVKVKDGGMLGEMNRTLEAEAAAAG